MVVVLAMVSSTACGVAVVDSGFIGPVAGLWSESCGLHESSYRVHSVCSGLYSPYYPTPLWFCGLWSGPCGLHEVYGLLIEGFRQFTGCL